MFLNAGAVGLRLALHTPAHQISSTSIISKSVTRSVSYSLAAKCTSRTITRNPPATSTTTPSSFFTPSLCRTVKRHASSAAAASATAPAQALDWNTFFRLRTSRRRYSLVSSILMSIATTGTMFVFLSTQPELADQITKIIPTDPTIGMGIATFAATFFGWLIGPVFGSAIWRLFHRTRLAEFTTKERAFFERVKKHRVNPSGASTNNPVPDYYGEKVGSVSGYRRWLKDQRAFNRKREGSYNATI